MELLGALETAPRRVPSKRYYLKPQGRASSEQPGIPQARKEPVQSKQPLAFTTEPLPADLPLAAAPRARLFVAVRTAMPPAAMVRARVEIGSATAAPLAVGEAVAALAECEVKTADDFGPMCVRQIDLDLSTAEGQALARGDQIQISVSLETDPAAALVLLYDSTLFGSYVELPATDLMAVAAVRLMHPAGHGFEIEVMDRAGSADLQDVGVLVLDANGRALNQRVSADFVKDLTPTLSLWRFPWDGPLPSGHHVIAVVRNVAGATVSGRMAAR